MSVMREYHESLQEILELLGIDEGAYEPDELGRAATSEIEKLRRKALEEAAKAVVDTPESMMCIADHASMLEYKQYPPANHLHMTWNLPVSRLQHWMDLTGVLSVSPWAARPKFIEGADRPQPLIHLLNGGEQNYKHLNK